MPRLSIWIAWSTSLQRWRGHSSIVSDADTGLCGPGLTRTLVDKSSLTGRVTRPQAGERRPQACTFVAANGDFVPKGLFLATVGGRIPVLEAIWFLRPSRAD